MAVDERYQNNLVITKDAFQNLLTNVKNYPIVDIDYVAEDDTDELHGDYVWENYTSGIPCIKITYGDDRTTKGNVIFAEEQRDLINKYKKILNQLRVTQNEYERLKNRWEKIYALNYQVYTEKQNQILRYKARFASTEVNKLAFLKAGWSLLQYNLVELFNPEINDVRTPLLKASNPEKFEYQEFLGPDNFDYEKVLLPDHENNTVTHNLEYIVLNEEQKGKIIDTLTTFRDILIDDGENESYFFTENERNTINSFINFIASFNYFSVLEAIGLAGYHYTSDQILIIKNNKVQINDSNRVAAFEPIGASANFNSDTSYYTPEYYTIYMNIGDADYNNENTYYLLNSDLSYSQYTYTTEADFNANRHLLYLKRQELFCYRLVTGLNATTFNNQRDNLYIQSSNSETIQSAVKAILPQIVDDIVWENLNNINLNFDSVYHEFSANIENIVNTLNSIVNPRLEIIEEELARYINILNTTEFTFEDESMITVSADEENIYSSNPETEDAIIANHLLDDPEAIKLKVQIINKIIANCNQLVEEIATGQKDKNGIPLQNGNNRILYGYKYVKVGSNITFRDTYIKSTPPYVLSNNETLEKDTSAEHQDSGTFRITINGKVQEVPIKGFTETTESNKPIYLLTKNGTGENAGPGQINFKGNVAGQGSIVINSGNLLMSSGAVAAATYQALQGYSEGPEYTPNFNSSDATNSKAHAGFWYDGSSNRLLRTWNITEDKDNVGLGAYQYVFTSDGTATTKSVNALGGLSYNDGTIEFHTGLPSSSNNTNDNLANIKINNLILAGSIPNLSTENAIITTATITNLTATNATINNLTSTGLTFSSIPNGSWIKAAHEGAIVIPKLNPDASNAQSGLVIKTKSGSWGISELGSGDNLYFVYGTKSNYDADNNETKKAYITPDGYFYAERVYKAVFNDSAECRKTIDLTPGHVVIDNDDGSLSCSSKRLQPGGQVISDTYGDLMGETEECKTPLAIAGRVLVYTYQPRENYHAGMAVCSAPGGTIDIMTREEIRDYPDCIIGIVSEIPSYENWGTANVKVDGRIWIKVK